MADLNPAVLVALLALDELDDMQLALLAMAADQNVDPRGLPGYDRVSYLWTEDVAGGLHLHGLTREAFRMAAAERMARHA